MTAIRASVEEEYVFVEDTDRLVVIVRGELLLFGKLDQRGEFLEQSRLKRGGPLSVPGEILNPPTEKPVPVYEFRSGRLIKGVLDTKGYFVPDLDAKVMEFKDYRFGPKEIPIWNLPGRVVPKGSVKK
jgi:hypothetical protein